jgi:aminoglycoside phosphotransferase (APT) family kinase protein
MESITKNRQSPETLRAMIAKAYGPEQVPAGDDFAEELGHGWFNVAYKLRLRDASHVVLKIAPPPRVEVMTYERGAMATELAALALIREATAVPVPAVDFADRSHELCDADWFVMAFIDADNFGIVRPTLTRAEQADCLDEVTEPRFVEWDLWDSNVMVRDGTIVDHERAYYGDPLIEAGFAATQLPAFGDSTAFLRGYGKTELTSGEQMRRRLYCLHLILIMIIETEYRGHTDTQQYDWARERLTEAMALFGRFR